MPANLTPQYKEAEARYREASTPEEKLACLHDMLRLLPKHKGTEKLQADLKRRISKFSAVETKKTARRVPGEFVDREGTTQTLLLGAANAGKSALVAALTEAKPEVAAYPYTTTRLAPGMMAFEDVQLQLVDLPAVSRELAKPWLSNQVRAADLILWVVSLADDDLLAAVEDVQALLGDWHLVLVPAGSAPAERDDDLEPRPALLVATHGDDEGAELRLELLRSVLGEGWPVHVVSVSRDEGLDALRRIVFDALHVVRVYTKVPGKKADMAHPFLLHAGSTVMDLAEAVHKDIAAGLKFARIWGADAFDGQHVQRDHVLADGDVVELHA